MGIARSCIWLVPGWLIAAAAVANPQGPQVVHGQVQVEGAGTGAMTITSTPQAIVNWRSFSIGAEETTRFVQHNAASAILNRVTGQDPSALLGQLTSNGQVYLINPNGLLVGPGARIDTAGFIGATLDIADEDFLAGRLRFEGGPGSGSIRNHGLIRARGDGGVYLIAPNIQNSGVVRTENGALLLAAGQKVQLSSLDLDSISVEVQAPEDAAVNLGELLTGGGALGVFAGTIRNHGVMEASAVEVGEAGEIRLVASSDIDVAASSRIAADGPRGGRIHMESNTGTTSLSGSASARGSDGQGGEVHVLGERVGLFDAAEVDVSGATGGGKVLIGGGFQGNDATVKNASVTYVDTQAAIKADALAEGDGGEVIVWADDTTRFLGSVSARGGPASGHGGFAEVSGKLYLDYRGSANLSAAHGESGTLLLDPNDITIQQAPPSANIMQGMLFDPWMTTDDDAVLTTGVIEADLANAAVSVQTASAGTNSQPGDIRIVDEITAPATANSLTLKSARNIVLEAELDFSQSTGSVTLDAQAVIINNGFTATGVDLKATNVPVVANSVFVLAGNSTFTVASLFANGGISVQGESVIHAANIELGGPVSGNAALVIDNLANPITIGGEFMSSSSAARFSSFSGGLSIGGSIPGVAGASGAIRGPASGITVSAPLRVAGDLALVSFGDISVQEGGLLASTNGTLTVAASLMATGDITDPGAGPPFFFQAPEVVLIANGAVGTAQNPLSVLSSATTVNVGSSTGTAFIDGSPGQVIGGGPKIQAIYNATCMPSCSYSANVLGTSATVAGTQSNTLSRDVAEPEAQSAPTPESEEEASPAAVQPAEDYNVSRLISLGPQLPLQFNIGEFAATGLVKAGWPILFSYDSRSGGGLKLRVSAPGVEALTFDAADSGGETRTVVLTVPGRFGSAVAPAVFEVVADGDADGRAQVRAIGAGPKAVGLVAIQSIMFQPPYVRAGAGQTAAYRFYSKSDFDEVAAEFMQVSPAAPGERYSFVNRQLIEDGVKQENWIGEAERRVWDGQAETGQLSAGRHKLQVRAWDDAGQWITAWSDALVTVAP